MNKKIQFSIKFEGKTLEKLNTLKKYYNIQNDAELIRILVNEKTQQLTANSEEALTNATQ